MDTEAAKPVPQQALDLARRIVDVLADRKATDIVLMDIHSLASFADYFVIGTANSERQMRAVSGAVVEALERDGARPAQVEGEPDSGWILMDYGDVVVHIFSPEMREFYQLERIWTKAPTILRML